MNFSLEMKEKFLIKFNIFEKYNAKKIMEEILIFDEEIDTNTAIVGTFIELLVLKNFGKNWELFL